MFGARARRAGIAFGWVGLVLATERWRPWGDAIRLEYATDERGYATIARAAPSFPRTKLDAAHADRFPLHWLVGEVTHVTLPLHAVYDGAMALVLAATLLVVGATLTRLRLSASGFAVAFGAVAASAYPMRYSLDARGMITDAAFVLGLAVATHGVVCRRPWVGVAGALVATVGRETGFVLGLVLAVLYTRERRVAAAVTAAAAPLALYVVERQVSAPFTKPGRTIVGMTVEGAWTAHNAWTHVGRVLVAVAIVLTLVAAAGRRVLVVPLALGGLVVVQALVLAPDWTHAEPRLAGLAVPALAVAAAPGVARVRPFPGALMALGVALASLHHLYTDVGVGSASRWGALTATGCVLVLAGGVVSRRRSPALPLETRSPQPRLRRARRPARATPR